MPNVDYLYVRAWCRMMGSYDYYVRQQVQQARADGAPERAIYKDVPSASLGMESGTLTDAPGGHWKTLDDVERADVRARIEKIVEDWYGPIESKETPS